MKKKKLFIYFENCDGGMEENIANSPKDFGLYGWMTHDCIEKDKELMEWSKNAKIGERFYHRLGVCVRVLAL